MARKNAAPPPGTKVGVHFGSRVVTALVIEDRGVFAGKRLVRIRLIDWESGDAPEFELPVDELEPVPTPA